MQENQSIQIRYVFAAKPGCTIDSTLHETLRRAPLEGTVQSAFPHAINILSLQHATLVTVVTEEVPCGAYCLRLPLPRFDGFEHMQGSSCVLELDQMPVQVFEAVLPYLTFPQNERRPRALMLKLFEHGNPGSVIPRENLGSWGQHLSETLIESTRLLCEATLAQDRLSFIDSFRMLCGLGSGLTPSGDDITAGFITALYAAHAPAVPFIASNARALLNHAATATNEVSVAQLHHALDHRGNEHVHRLIHAINSGNDSAIEAACGRVISIGSSSGTDFLYGFIVALQLLDPASEEAITYSDPYHRTKKHAHTKGA